MPENSDSFTGSPLISRLRYALRLRVWLVPLVFATVGGVVGLAHYPGASQR